MKQWRNVQEFQNCLYPELLDSIVIISLFRMNQKLKQNKLNQESIED
jgi:hypothetical protein